jgi:hypothetical protein
MQPGNEEEIRAGFTLKRKHCNFFGGLYARSFRSQAEKPLQHIFFAALAPQWM